MNGDAMSNFKKMSWFLLVFVLLNAFKSDQIGKTIYISVGTDTLKLMQEHFSIGQHISYEDEKFSVIEVPEDKIEIISQLIHKNFGRCGGFMVEATKDNAILDWTLNKKLHKADPDIYSIGKHEDIFSALPKISEKNILQTIDHLSRYKNRYYRSSYGQKSQEYVLKLWKKITGNHPKITVEKFHHSDFPQTSIVLNWEGSENETEIVVLGGHGDSIAGFFPSNHVSAPGADDNASGIATISEVLKVLIDIDFQPKRSIKFISYAAEEVGLKGSHHIAQKAHEDGLNIVGVLQLDMTNFKGSMDDIILISDHTDQTQNEFIGQLIDTYLPELSWSYHECGYACSDHASWTRYGYPASFPFEARMDEYNPEIHTGRDTLNISNNSSAHARKFAKLALAYLYELSS